MATIDYMVASYGPYSASATGGNALARDFLAGVAAMYSVPSKLQQPPRCTYLNTGPKLTQTSVRTHEQFPSARMGLDVPGLHVYSFHHPDLYLLLVWAEYPREIQVRTGPC